LDAFDHVLAEPEGDDPENSKGAVDEAPGKGNASKGAHDEGEGDDEGTGDHAELDDPDIFDGVTEWADEKDGEDEMGEGEPIGSISDEGVVGINDIEGIADFEEPFCAGFSGAP
jgi:hypothetical protein